MYAQLYCKCISKSIYGWKKFESNIIMWDCSIHKFFLIFKFHCAVSTKNKMKEKTHTHTLYVNLLDRIMLSGTI